MRIHWLRPMVVLVMLATPLMAQPARAGARATMVQKPSIAAISRASAIARVDSAKLVMIRTRVDTTPKTRVSPASVAASRNLIEAIATPVAAADTQQKRVGRVQLEGFFGAGRGQLKLVRNGKAAPIPATSDSITILKGDGIFHKSAEAPMVASRASLPQRLQALSDSATVYEMPYRWLVLDSAGVTRLLKPYFALVGEGLAFNIGEDQFTGSALLGVEDSLHPLDASQKLLNPLRLVLNTTHGGRLSNLQFKIDHTSQDYDLVGVSATDTTSIRLTTGADTAGIIFAVPLLAPKVSLRASSSTIEAFGVQTTNIIVSPPFGLSPAEEIKVVLTATGAAVHPETVMVARGRNATARLRSSSPGDDIITASIGGVDVGHVSVHFGPPWMFLSATLAGVLLGGVGRFVSAKRRKKISSLPWDIMKGFPFGVVAAAASAVGLDLVGLGIKEPGAWIAVFVVAAAGSMLGQKILERKPEAKPAT
ncbi:MAG: hypothetical protein M3081_06560 [Gemmatimonadota bacterium]|nr:hypothetical protein [Gemmatimonadota bacterium]